VTAIMLKFILKNCDEESWKTIGVTFCSQLGAILDTEYSFVDMAAEDVKLVLSHPELDFNQKMRTMYVLDQRVEFTKLNFTHFIVGDSEREIMKAFNVVSHWCRK